MADATHKEDIVKSIISSAEFRVFMKDIISEVVDEKLTKRIEVCEGEIHEARCDIDKLRAESNEEKKTRKHEVRELESKLATTQKDLGDLQQYSRRNNLRFAGIPELKGENTAEIIKRIAIDTLDVELDDWDIDRSQYRSEL